jgi:phenylacetate-CoA ligase
MLIDYQARCLQSVVRHAVARVRYYRRLFAAAGVCPADVRTRGDLGRLPLTSRSELQGLPATDLIATGVNPGSLMTMLSSGSSGEPFATRRPRLEHWLLLAFRLRAFQLWGLRLRDRTAAVLWPGRSPRRRPLYSYLGMRRESRISCLLPTDRILEELRSLRFEVLDGLPVTLAEVSGLLTERDRAAMRPRFVMVGGESSTPEQRRRVAETFQAPVYDLYGTNEFNMTAWQCPETGLYHVADPVVILEVLDEHGRAVPAGEEGEVVATGLQSFAMPFIRYRLDDLAVRGETPCPCGAPWSTLVRISGRVPERFVTPSGLRLHPYDLQEAFMPDTPWVQGFQIVQERRDLVRVKLRPLEGRTPAPEDLTHVASAVERAMGGEGVRVIAELVEQIPRGPGGKARAYVRHVR